MCTRVTIERDPCSHVEFTVEFSSGENADTGGPKRRDEVANYLEA